MLYFPICGGILTWSLRLLISSTLLLEAASSSWILKDLSVLNDWHDSHSSHASPFSFRLKQFIVLARIRAHVVLPTPLGPQNRYACDRWLFLIALFRVLVIVSWPTTISNVAGRYFLAETIKFSIKGMRRFVMQI